MQKLRFSLTDSDSDLPLELTAQQSTTFLSSGLRLPMDGKEYFDDLGQSLNHKSFYDKMRAGSQPTTSALNETVYMEYFEPILSSGATCSSQPSPASSARPFRQFTPAAKGTAETVPGTQVHRGGHAVHLCAADDSCPQGT